VPPSMAANRPRRLHPLSSFSCQGGRAAQVTWLHATSACFRRTLSCNTQPRSLLAPAVRHALP
jgi:hypothetical protein